MTQAVSAGWCAPDSLAQAHLLKSCSKTDNWKYLIRPEPTLADVTFINCGANKGYEIAEFLARWAPQRGISNRGWYIEIAEYAARKKSKHLKWSAAGGCHERPFSLWIKEWRSGARVAVAKE